jgi:hypothetical protein
MDGDRSWHDLATRQPGLPGDAGAADWLRAVESAAFAALRAGTAGDGAATLEHLCRRWPDSARLHWLHALLLREDQRHDAALQAISGAGDDAQARALLAQLRYETGRPAAAAFAAARALAPADMALIRGHAGALAAEAEGAAALALMRRTLADRPDWVDGQSYAATLHRLLGADGRDDTGFAQACRAQPHNLALRLGWFYGLAKAKDWDAARAVIADGIRLLGDAPALAIAQLYLAAESGEADDRPDLFDSIADRADAGLALARVRHALRCGAPDRAAQIAEAQVMTPSAALFWPYLSLCWRLLGDARADWLDRPDQLIRVTTLDLDYAALAELLRGLHNAAAPYPDQSVRGGTQTDRPLLFRHEPIIQSARAAIIAAVSDYIAALPPPEPGHPLLGTPRGEVKLAGSWSVRLGQQGYHAAHSHPAGWISSALYIALPDAMGAAPAGWLRFGTSPPELGLDLPPYRDVQPQVGQLVLFPSTLWHGTVPFDDGERLSIAFDIRPPR